jgi:hypothetical protein
MSRRAILTACAVAGALVLVAACTDLFGPENTVRPQMRALQISYLSSTSGIMHVEGYPADKAFRLESGQSAPIEIRVSSGDRERLALYPEYCPPRARGWKYICFEFDVLTRNGYDVRSLAGYAAGIGGRMQWVIGGWLGRVVLFSLGDQVSAARRALSWPGVASVELAPIGFCLEGSDCIDWSQLTRPVQVDTGAPVPGDGVVQVRSGDTVTVFYKQPGGLTVQAQAPVP